jgi:hypothetical protein
MRERRLPVTVTPPIFSGAGGGTALGVVVAV